MELSPHVEAIRSALRSVAGEDEATVAVAERLSSAIDASLQLQLLDMLSQIALELTEQLPSGRIELRLAGRDAQLVYADSAAEPTSSSSGDDDGTTARLTLRMSEGLKVSLEAAAAGQGVSTNAWLVNAVKRALDQNASRKRGVGNRLTGYAQG
jgi:hypothetical protein